MKIFFLGTNGWYDTETGNTICTLLRSEQYDIILDAGNGIHRADEYLDGKKPVFLFISHFHIDHIEGLHILAKFKFSAGLFVCTPTGGREILDTFLNDPFTIPLASLEYPTNIIELPGNASSLPFSVEALPLRHSTLTLGYRIAIDNSVVCYCPDTGYCENAPLLARSADLLITECAYRHGDSSDEWPHLNPETAARIAVEAGAKRLALTHFDASVYKSIAERKESEAVAAEIFAATTSCTDGLVMTL